MIKSMKSGFTLAEVLTTLMVIGVVAAMTIPTLLNSTNEQQSKVACKKAASILSQGIQLLVAKEETCSGMIADNEGLAQCMSQVITGTRAGNAITTPDGMVYAFYVPDDNVDTGDLETVCGTSGGTSRGKNACGVVVDTNGFQKGTKTAFADDGTTFTKANGFTSDVQPSSDRVAFRFSTSGAKPIATPECKTNYSWKYIYGTAPETQNATYLCCTGEDHYDRASNTHDYDDVPQCTEGPDTGKYICEPVEQTTPCDAGKGQVDVSVAGSVTACN